MISRYLSLPIMIVAAILQSTLMIEFQIRDGRGDLILALVIGWTLLAGADEGIVWAIMGGLCQDVVTGVPLGTSALALVIVAFGIGALVAPIGRGNLIVPVPAIVAATLVYHVLLLGLYALLGRSVSPFDSLLNDTLPTAALNVVLILPIFRLLGALYEASFPRRVGL